MLNFFKLRKNKIYKIFKFILLFFFWTGPGPIQKIRRDRGRTGTGWRTDHIVKLNK